MGLFGDPNCEIEVLRTGSRHHIRRNYQTGGWIIVCFCGRQYDWLGFRFRCKCGRDWRIKDDPASPGPVHRP